MQYTQGMRDQKLRISGQIEAAVYGLNVIEYALEKSLNKSIKSLTDKEGDRGHAAKAVQYIREVKNELATLNTANAFMDKYPDIQKELPNQVREIIGNTTSLVAELHRVSKSASRLHMTSAEADHHDSLPATPTCFSQAQRHELIAQVSKYGEIYCGTQILVESVTELGRSVGIDTHTLKAVSQKLDENRRINLL